MQHREALALAVLFALASAGCEQRVFVGSVPDGGADGGDAGSTPDGGGVSDAGDGDGGGSDGGESGDGGQDAGPQCSGAFAPSSHLLVGGSVFAPNLVSNANGYLAAWSRVGTVDDAWWATADDTAVLSPVSEQQLEPDVLYPRAAPGPAPAFVFVSPQGPPWPAAAVYFQQPPSAAVRLSEFSLSNAGTGIAWNPERLEWGVAWSGSQIADGGLVSFLHFVRIDSTGAVVPDSGVTLPHIGLLAEVGSSPLVWSAGRFALVSRDNTTVQLALLDGTGGLLATGSIDSGVVAPDYALVAGGDGGFGVVWIDQRGGFFQIRFALMDSAGAYVSGSDVPVSSVRSNDPSIAWDGKDFGVTWNDLDGGSIEFSRISAAGALLSTTPLTDAGLQVARTSLDWNGCQYAATYELYPSTGGEVGAFVTLFR